MSSDKKPERSRESADPILGYKMASMYRTGRRRREGRVLMILLPCHTRTHITIDFATLQSRDGARWVSPDQAPN